MEVIWSESALGRISDIGSFIAVDSPVRAGHFVDHMIASVGRLAKFSFSGPLIPENPAFRQIVFEKYRIIYRITGRGVEIATVVSPGQGAAF